MDTDTDNKGIHSKFQNVGMRKNFRSSNETCILIGKALSLDLAVLVTSDILTHSHILKLRVNTINIHYYY